MGLLPTNIARQRTAADDVNLIRQINAQFLQQKVQFIKLSYDKVWKNQFTAKEMVEAMGTDALTMFTEHGLEQDAIARVMQENGLTYTRLQPLYKVTLVLDENNNPTGALTIDMNTPYGS
jgi:hypothetical protein